MTSVELNQELFQQLAIISGDEGLMRKAVKALKRIAGQAETKDETDYILDSTAMIDIIRQGDEEIAQGNLQTIRLEELWK